MNKSKFLSVTATPKLAAKVIAQAGGWDDFKSMVEDVVDQGADSGFSGFTYYIDTITFARKALPLIRERLKLDADDIGESMISLVKNFRCLNGDYSEDEIGLALFGGVDSDEFTQIYNALSWYALETTAYDYVSASDRS